MKIWRNMTLLLLSGMAANCERVRNNLAGTSGATCQLTPGEYTVQSASHDADTGSYRVLLLGAPACLPQPVNFPQIKLERLTEESKEKARLILGAQGGDVTLAIAQDFQLQVVQRVADGQGGMQEKTSMWSPFLAGAVGGAVGSVIGGALGRSFSRPGGHTGSTTAPPAPAHIASPGMTTRADAQKAPVTRSYERRSVSQKPPGPSRGFFRSRRR